MGHRFLCELQGLRSLPEELHVSAMIPEVLLEVLELFRENAPKMESLPYERWVSRDSVIQAAESWALKLQIFLLKTVTRLLHSKRGVGGSRALTSDGVWPS